MLTSLKAKFLAWKLDYLSPFLLAIFYYGRLQWSRVIGDSDAFYHAKMALFLRQGEVLQSMPWMQFSNIREKFVDHQFLYHALLAPFTYISDNPLIGIKIATVFFTAAMIMTFYWLLKKWAIVWPWLFAACFMSFEAMTFRLNLVKINSLSLIMLWLVIYALFSKNKKLLFCLGFVYVWLYGGWPLAILITLIFLVSEFIYSYLHKNKLLFIWRRLHELLGRHKNRLVNLKLLLALGAGSILGAIVHPYWPHNLYFYYQLVVQIGVVNLGNKLAVGNEWYPVGFLRLVSYAPLLFIAAFIIFVLLSFVLKKVSRRTWFSFLLSFIFMLLTLKSRRHVEYYIPFALLFTACGVTDLIKIVNWTKIKKIWSDLRLTIQFYLLLSLMVMLTLVMPGLYQDLIKPATTQRWHMTKFQGGAQWLQKNTPPGSTVFNNMWDDWALFFYHNDHNYYIIGLEPTLMYNYDPALTKKYFDITLYEDESIHYTPDQVVEIIRKDFHSRYVVVEKNKTYQQLITNLRAAFGTKQKYEDEELIIFEL